MGKFLGGEGHIYAYGGRKPPARETNVPPRRGLEANMNVPINHINFRGVRALIKKK